MPSKIEWTEETWNPVTGCTKVSPGCAHCYAETLCRRFWKQWDREPPPDHFRVKLHPDRMDQPLHWKKPRRVFVCSMSDLFHERVTWNFLLDVFTMIKRTKPHIYQILTKRPERMREIMKLVWASPKPLPHVWLGVTAEDQKRADERIPHLLKIPARVRFVSVEPMLEPVNLEPFMALPINQRISQSSTTRDWVIIGCESGPNRRPMKLEWALDLVRQCKAVGLAVFVKQLDIDGRVSKNPTEWPKELRIREYPQC